MLNRWSISELNDDTDDRRDCGLRLRVVLLATLGLAGAGVVLMVGVCGRLLVLLMMVAVMLIRM